MRVLQGLEGKSSRVKAIYVDCWQHSTRMAVYSLVARAIDEMMPRRGLALDEVYGRIIEMMEKDGTRVLLVLDGIEGLFRNGEERLLDDVDRDKPLFGVIGITNDAKLLAKLSEEGSYVRLAKMEFKHYRTSELSDILAERAKAALRAERNGRSTVMAQDL